MKPIINETKLHYDVGEKFRGRKIVEIIPCAGSAVCRRVYKNFDITCSGFRRRLEEDFGGVCVWHITQDKKYLTDKSGGDPLL